MSSRDGTVSFDAPGGSIDAYIATPSTPAPWPALIIIHPVTGLTDNVNENARSFADEGYLALAPDLYTNDAGYSDHSAENINEAAHMGPNSSGWDAHLAKVPQARRSAVLAARQWMTNRPHGSYIELIRASFDYLKQRTDVGPIGSIGYCMGGRLTGELAALGVDLAAGVIYYGGSPKAEEAANVKGPLAGHYAVTDRGITGGVYEFALAMKAAGKSFEYCVYDADHGFNDATAPHAYNAGAARTARRRASEFLAQHLLEQRT
jgi:carboxymethylenebutenolidase